MEHQFKFSTGWSNSYIKSGLTDTSYTFDFVGKQPGRWQVWAIDENGIPGPKSGWWGFTYLQ